MGAAQAKMAQQVQVIVSDGAQPGDLVHFEYNGVEYGVVVPDGVFAGMRFMADMAPPSTKQLAAAEWRAVSLRDSACVRVHTFMSDEGIRMHDAASGRENAHADPRTLDVARRRAGTRRRAPCAGTGAPCPVVCVYFVYACVCVCVCVNKPTPEPTVILTLKPEHQTMYKCLGIDFSTDLVSSVPSGCTVCTYKTMKCSCTQCLTVK
jgi:hypothetical protein